MQRLPAILIPLIQAFCGAAFVTGQFSDQSQQAGIQFRHFNGAFGQKYLPETMGSGGAFFDADGDGRLDIYFANSTHFAGQKDLPYWPAFYRNLGNGSFADETAAAGLKEKFFGMGIAAADFDNDGDVDFYVTALGPNKLYENDGKGHFVEIAAKAGVAEPGFGSSAAWLDYDRDGNLDLFVANYVQWQAETDIFCSIDGTHKSYCSPEPYKGAVCRLFRNRGDGTFGDVTQAVGLYRDDAKALGVLAVDFNNDHWVDLFVANDTQANFLFQNNKGNFEDVGLLAGIAFSETGAATGSMGVDSADYDGSGRLSVIMGNFSNEMFSLYHNEGEGFFIDEAPRSELGRATLLTLTFSCFFFDFDLDGLFDIFAANGHVQDDINTVQKKVTYAQLPQLFRNTGAGKYVDVSSTAGEPFAEKIVGRGAAYGDYDQDGDPDLLVTTNNGPAYLWRNDRQQKGHFIRVQLSGNGKNTPKNPIGATVAAIAGGQRVMQQFQGGRSYLSQNETIFTFGLGASTSVDALEITWPDETTAILNKIPCCREIHIEMGKKSYTTNWVKKHD